MDVKSPFFTSTAQSSFRNHIYHYSYRAQSLPKYTHKLKEQKLPMLALKIKKINAENKRLYLSNQNIVQCLTFQATYYELEAMYNNLMREKVEISKKGNNRFNYSGYAFHSLSSCYDDISGQYNGSQMKNYYIRERTPSAFHVEPREVRIQFNYDAVMVECVKYKQFDQDSEHIMNLSDKEKRTLTDLLYNTYSFIHEFNTVSLNKYFKDCDETKAVLNALVLDDNALNIILGNIDKCSPFESIKEFLIREYGDPLVATTIIQFLPGFQFEQFQKHCFVEQMEELKQWETIPFVIDAAKRTKEAYISIFVIEHQEDEEDQPEDQADVVEDE